MTFRLILLLAAAGVVQTGRTLDQYIESVTGAGAVDCGTFSMIHNGMALPPRPASKATTKVESMRESLACAAQALTDHKGFKIVQNGQGFDSEVSTGVLGDAQGVTVWFESLGTPCGWPGGGPGCGRSFHVVKPCSLKDVRIVPTPGEKNQMFKCGD